jgi:hypothetical protein
MKRKRKNKRMTERRLEQRLSRLLDRVLSDHGGGWTETFAEAGVLTDSRGVVLHIGNGQQFQLTIVESTRP